MSIQGMMFTPDPCFNEPGYEGIKGTDEGDVSVILCKSSQGSTLCHTLLTTDGNSKSVLFLIGTVKICQQGLYREAALTPCTHQLVAVNLSFF